MRNSSILNKIHYILEIASYVVMLGAIIAGVVSFVVAKQIPTKTDFVGNVTAEGSSEILIMLPIILLITNMISSLMLHFMPFTSWNMPVKVKPERAVLVYGTIAYMVVIMELLFSVFTLVQVLILLAGYASLSGVVAIVMVVLLFIDIGVFTVWSIRRNR